MIAPSKFGLSATIVVALGATMLYFTAQDATHAQDARNTRPASAVPVTVATVEQQTVPVRVQAIGNVDAYATVAIKARIDGQVTAVNFREGQKLAKGAVLFQIDPRPFETSLRQAEANLIRDTAQRDQTRSQERRYRELLEKNFVSKEAYAQIRTNAESAAAVALASQAAVENAKLQLEYATIRAPLSGYVGKILLQPGNLVKANDANPLVVINQVQPIYVSFAVPEQYLAEIRARMAKSKLRVEVGPQNSAQTASDGVLSFVDNAIDPATGTIKLKAEFPNKSDSLWPGQFVNVSLRLFDQADALVVPAQAVQTGPKGQFTYVVKPDMTIEVRPLEVQRMDGESAVVAKGLSKGELVVTKGQLRLATGTRVDIAKPRSGKP